MSSSVIISGPDGSGKTTVAKLIVKLLRKRGYPALYTWLRYPRFFSVFPLFISRILGITIKIKRNDLCSYTYHAYEVLPILGTIYELLILIDYVIYKLIKVWLPSKLGFIVVVDRSLLDITVDVYIETKSTPRILLRYLSYEIKNSTNKAVILTSLENLLVRRRDNLCNPYIEFIVKLYKRLGLIYGYKIYYNDTLADLAKILHYMTINFRPVRIYADPSNQLLRALYYKHRWLIYVTNFIFQTMGYMWWVELAFRLAIQALIIILMIIFGFHPLVALVVSHVVLYPLCTNLLDLKKWFNMSVKMPNADDILKKIVRLETFLEKYKFCIDALVVGSLSRNPNIFFMKEVDLDVRIVPKSNSKCILISLILAMYLRLWRIFNGVPIDLYVKPKEDPEVQSKYAIPLNELLAILRSIKAH